MSDLLSIGAPPVTGLATGARTPVLAAASTPSPAAPVSANPAPFQTAVTPLDPALGIEVMQFIGASGIPPGVPSPRQLESYHNAEGTSEAQPSGSATDGHSD